MKNIFDNIGMSYIWNSQCLVNDNDVKGVIKQRLIDHFHQSLCGDASTSSRGEFYLNLKNEFCIEKYLLKLNKADRIVIHCKKCVYERDMFKTHFYFRHV